MMGYAAMEGEGSFYNAGGTTGGKGGTVVTPQSFAELKRYVEDEKTPYVILIDREFTSEQPCYVISSTGALVSKETAGASISTYGEVLKIGSNKSIIGVGDKAFFNRIGLNVNTQSNIIIRNIKFTFNGVPTSRDGEMKVIALRNGVEVLVGDPDCISIQADINSASKDFAHHFWVDHCEFFNGDAATKDRYDGLLDMKNNVQYTTISWCKFHNHDKACLSGKGNSDDYPRTVTMHHNYFYDIQGSRLPLQRGGFYHYFNNYLENCQDGYDLRAKAQSYIEGCYFKDTKSPVMPSGEGEGATLTDVIFENCRRIPAEYAEEGVKYDQLYTIPSSEYRPPYHYAAFLHNASEVPVIVPKYVGVGIIEDEYSSVIGKSPVVNIISPAPSQEFLFPASVAVNIQATDEDGTITEVIVSVNNEKETVLTTAPYITTISGLTAGIHIMTVKAKDNDGNTTTKTVSFIMDQLKPASVKTLPATNITSNNAVLNAEFTPNSQVISVKGFALFEAGEFNGFYELMLDQDSSIRLSLKEETDYRYRAYIVVDSDSLFGEYVDFKTLKEGAEPEPLPGNALTIDSETSLPAGFAINFAKDPYTYDGASKAANLIMIAAGTYKITLPANIVVTKFVVTGCTDNNADDKGTVTVAGQSLSLPGRKSEYKSLELSNVSIKNEIEYVLTYKSGLKFYLEFEIANSISDLNNSSKEIVSVEYYTVAGQQLNKVASKGITIVKTKYNDGTSESSKVIR